MSLSVRIADIPLTLVANPAPSFGSLLDASGRSVSFAAKITGATKDTLGAAISALNTRLALPCDLVIQSTGSTYPMALRLLGNGEARVADQWDYEFVGGQSVVQIDAPCAPYATPANRVFLASPFGNDMPTVSADVVASDVNYIYANGGRWVISADATHAPHLDLYGDCTPGELLVVEVDLECITLNSLYQMETRVLWLNSGGGIVSQDVKYAAVLKAAGRQQFTAIYLVPPTAVRLRAKTQFAETASGACLGYLHSIHVGEKTAAHPITPPWVRRGGRNPWEYSTWPSEFAVTEGVNTETNLFTNPSFEPPVSTDASRGTFSVAAPADIVPWTDAHWLSFPSSVLADNGDIVTIYRDALRTATITCSDVLANDTIVIDTHVTPSNPLTFTAHATTTTKSLRQFSISGSDSQDADELCACINDATYGVPDVVAVNVGGVITLTPGNIAIYITVVPGSGMGTRLICVTNYTEGRYGCLYQVTRSASTGLWGAPVLLDTAISSSLGWHSCTLTCRRSTGTLWRYPRIYDNSGAGATVRYYSYSTDHGATWSAVSALSTPTGMDKLATVGEQGGRFIEVVDDDTAKVIIMAYGWPTGIEYNSVVCLESTDCMAWTVRAVVATGTESMTFNESSVERMSDGSLVCVMRTSAATGALYQSRSLDNGLTWSAPTAVAPVGAWEGWWGHAPVLRTLQDGSTMCIHRGRDDSDSACILAMMSIDSGVTWGTPAAIDTYSVSGGYGSFAFDRSGYLHMICFGDLLAQRVEPWIKEYVITPHTRSWLPAGWALSKSVTGTPYISSVDGRTGGFAQRMQYIAVAGDTTKAVTFQGPMSGVGTVAPGDVVYISGYVRGVVAGCVGYLMMRFYNSAGTIISSVGSTVTVTTEWTRVHYHGTAPALTSRVRGELTVQNVDVGTSDTLDVAWDDALIGVAPALFAYFDGTTSGCDWSGVARCSTSVRTVVWTYGACYATATARGNTAIASLMSLYYHPVTAGESYGLRFSSSVTEYYSGSVSAVVCWYDAALSYLSRTTHTYSADTGLANTYVTTTAPAGAAYGVAGVMVWAGAWLTFAISSLRLSSGIVKTPRAIPLTAMAAEVASPLWVYGECDAVSDAHSVRYAIAGPLTPPYIEAESVIGWGVTDGSGGWTTSAVANVLRHGGYEVRTHALAAAELAGTIDTSGWDEDTYEVMVAICAESGGTASIYCTETGVTVSTTSTTPVLVSLGQLAAPTRKSRPGTAANLTLSLYTDDSSGKYAYCDYICPVPISRGAVVYDPGVALASTVLSQLDVDANGAPYVDDAVDYTYAFGSPLAATSRDRLLVVAEEFQSDEQGHWVDVLVLTEERYSLWR